MDDLRHFHVPTWWHLNRVRVWVAIVIALWVIAMLQPAKANVVTPDYESIAKKYAGIIAHCANGGWFKVEDILVECNPINVPVSR